MDDQSVATTSNEGSASLAYLFWTTGSGRRSYVRLKPDGTTIGSGARSEVVISDEEAAPEQARIRVEDGAWFMYDLSAGGPTQLEGENVYRAELRDGARVTLGRSSAVFRVVG